MLTHKNIEELYSYDPSSYLVSSLYLQITPDRSPNQLMTAFKGITDKVRKEEFPGKTKNVKASLEQDLEKFKEFIKDKDVRKDMTRTVALFSCAEEDYWEAYRIPALLDSHFSVSRYPYIRPLSAILDQSHRTLVVGVDRNYARFLDLFMNTIVSETTLESEVPKDVKEGGFKGFEEKRISRHIEDHVDKHMKKVASHCLETVREEDMDYIIIAGHSENTNKFEDFLHSYLEKRLIGTFEVKPADAKHSLILEKATPLIERAEQEKEKNAVESLKNEVGREGRGVAGIEETVDMLNEKKVRTLILNNEFEAEGSECPFCDTLSSQQPGTCEFCNKLTQPVEDLVDRAIGASLRDGGGVEHIFSDQEFIQEHGVGALLHY